MTDLDTELRRLAALPDDEFCAVLRRVAGRVDPVPAELAETVAMLAPDRDGEVRDG